MASPYQTPDYSGVFCAQSDTKALLFAVWIWYTALAAISGSDQADQIQL